jgi:hypothetical protein
MILLVIMKWDNKRLSLMNTILNLKIRAKFLVLGFHASHPAFRYEPR